MILRHCAGFFFLLLATHAVGASGVGYEFWTTEDSEGTETRRAGASWQVQRQSATDWWGVNVERASFRGLDWRRNENRVFFRGAGGGDQWRWLGRIGTNGETWIGDATLYSTSASRSELFLERDRLETRNGALQGRYQTFVGAAQDWPVHSRVVLTAVAGLQDFTGGNRRTHLRGTASFTFSEPWGLATQLRARWFKDHEPERADFFAPGEYSEALATVVWSRGVGRVRARIVLGAGQRQLLRGSPEPARLAEALIETPQHRRGPRFRLRLGYSDAPQAGAIAPDYRYRYVGLDGSWPL